MKHNLLKSVIISVILLMGVSNAWADDGDFYNTYLTYTFGATNGSAEDQDNGTGLSKDLGTLKSGSFKVTAVYLKCWDDWQTGSKSGGGQMCYQKDGGNTQYLQGFSRSNKSSGSNNYEWQNTNANLTIANSTDKSGSYTLSCWFQTWGDNWGDRFFPKSSGNYTFTYKIAPPSVKGFTVTPSGNKLSGSGTQNDPYIIKYNGSLTLTLSGSQNHTDANSTIQYNTSGTWDTTKSRTISNITSTVVKNITVKARYKNNSDADLCGDESSQTIYYRSEQIYTVTFNANGHGTAPAAQTVSQGSKATQPAAPTATGYTFGGWYKEAGCTNAFDFNTAINANITLYAKWTANKYTVTLSNQGATTAGTASVQATYDAAMPSATMPTKTGYTFGGYYTSNNGGGTQYYNADGASAKNWAIASNSTLYAKWTAITYSVKFNGNGNTSGSMSNQSFTYDVAEKALTTNGFQKIGYSFVGWNTAADGSGTSYKDKQSVKNLTTENNATITLYAQWTALPPKTVYLRPLDFWPSNNARFAVYYWEGDANGWAEMNIVGCEKDYYYADIPEGYTNFKYVRLNPTGKGNASKNDGLHFDYRWNETGNLKVQEKMLYTTPRIYLKPNDNWKTDDARFAAYFFEDGKEAKWMSMYKDGDYYYCNMVEGYSKVIFCRMNPATETNEFANCWNKSADQAIAGNCFTVTEGQWGDNPNDQYDNEAGAAGTWSEHSTTYNPTYSVTLEPTPYGHYTVEYNGRTYKSATDKNVVIEDVALGATIRVSKGTPDNSAEYTDDMLLQKASGYGKTELKGGEYYDHTICGTTTITENFVTKNPHTVYLRVPTTLAKWYEERYATPGANCVYYTHILGGGINLMEDVTGTINGEDGYKYYQFTIPAGYRTFCFQYKYGTTPESYTPRNYTANFTHAMPFTNGLNCFTILGSDDDDYYYGEWGTLLQKNDYRLLYIEQEVTLEDGHPKTTVTKAHPSDIIKYNDTRTTYSLHIYNKVENGENGMNDPEILVQQWNGSNWITKERHMVFGPLHADFGMAAMPGRRDAAGDPDAVLRYDNGIEEIKKEIKKDINTTDPRFVDDQASGVWNFIVTRDESNDFAGLDLKQTARYTGDYYVRTDCADGGWYNYTNPNNHMTRSDISKRNSNYSHYFCKWVKSNNDVNVKFTVANDYGYAISDTLEADRTDLWGVELTEAQKMLKDQTLPENANVRFTWNEKSNLIHRAYIAGSAVVSDRFLVLEGDANIFDADGNALNVSGLNTNEQIFRDNSNWIYYADVQMKPMAPVKVTAKYNDQTQYFIGKQNETVTLLQGSGSEKYLIRMLYNFKTNQLISAYVPGGSDKVNAISTNLMLIRQDNNEATQLIFNSEAAHDMETIPADRRAYGVIEFTKERLIDNQSLNVYERSLYWISFPFDVDVSKAICFGEYGKHWVIEEYDGATRAKEGCWLDSESFWKYYWDKNITLEAGKGYVLGLDVDLIRTDDLFGLSGDRPIGIYFPSNTPIDEAIVNQTDVTTSVPEHICTINRATPQGDRRIKDSHWNVIGTPSYVNAIGEYNEFYTTNIETTPKELNYYYQWLGEYNKYSVVQAGTQTFQPLYSYMVQYAGTINWQSIWNENPKAIAAQKYSDNTKEHHLCLEIHKNGNKEDHTFVRLQDKEEVTESFNFNYDLCKIINAGANIYSIITAEASPVEVAANVLPVEETIIPLGVKTDKAGEYTFAMPEGTDGIVVELIDYQANTTTNLLLSDYTITLPKGTNDTRFALHVKPSKVVTGVENIDNSVNGLNGETVKKYLIDGVLYLKKGNLLYDAQGRCVQ